MDYQEFKTDIIDILRDFYGKDAMVTVIDVLKNNGVRYDSVSIFFTDHDEKVIPAIYLNGLYQQYAVGDMTLEDCVGEIIQLRERNNHPEDICQIIGNLWDWSFVKDNVYPALLSTEENHELLECLVTRTFLDLSVVYIVRMTMADGGLGSVKINKLLFEQYGISREELQEKAIMNLEKDDYKLVNLLDTIKSILEEDMPKQCSEYLSDILAEPVKMYVLTNAFKLYGAAGILSSNFLRENSGGRNYFILPSSIHETIFVPAEEGMSQKEFDNMVKEINTTQLSAEELLANHSYYYDTLSGEIQIYQ